jgi:cell wall-associated NlpC family hydrolase
VLRAADALVGDPYLWGGRTPGGIAAGGQVTGIDCSGLVNLVYRRIGRAIPRDAHEQFLRVRRIEALKPADLVFLSAPGDPAKIVHVMLYAGEGQIIEGPGTGQAVRRIALAERLNLPPERIRPGALAGDQTISFGTVFP